MLLYVLGGFVYWRASRRRALVPAPWPQPVVIPVER
jgi:hypothetical protein